jgi:PAS domain S-box-containing protein
VELPVALRKLFSLPDPDAIETTRVVALTRAAAFLFLGVDLVWTAVLVPQTRYSQEVAVLGLSMAAVNLWCASIARRGHPRLAGGLLVGMLWAAGTFGIVVSGIGSLGLGGYAVAVVASGVLVGGIAASLTVLLCTASISILGWLQMHGIFAPYANQIEPIGVWAGNVAVFVACGGLVWVALSRIGLSQRRAEAAESLQLLIAANARDLIWTAGPDGIVTYASPAAERILGFAPEELVELANKSPTEILAPQSAVPIAERYRRAVQEGETSFRYEAEHRTRQGGTVWCEVEMTVLRDRQGRFQGFLGLTRDISERKRAEAERQALEEGLRRSQKLEAVGRLAGGIAHDFNNQLTVILGHAERLALRLPPDSSHQEDVRAIREAAASSAAFTRQLLALGRRQALKPTDLDLNEFLRQREGMLRRLVPEHIALRCDLDEAARAVRVDPAQLEQILINLIVNARDAMPQGGALLLRTGCEQLGSHAQALDAPPGRYTTLSVQDEGCGMNEETRKRIFEPFFTTKENGSGLGLATVYGIVKQSRGTIDVQSREGGGTTITIFLPTCEGASEVDGDGPGGGIHREPAAPAQVQGSA